MELPEIKHFSLRVYALIINDKAQVLLSDEYLFNQKMTKFPGGGMHFGEGTIDCILREAIEEFGQEIEVTEHFYTTHFFQRALFYSDHQLISIYYRGRFRDKALFLIQGEYRALVTRRIGVAGFAGLADVFPGFDRLGAGRWKFAVGSGLRYVINKRDGTTVRLDMAWGQESFGLYITAQEAF